jgi:hypothetical protein
MRGARLFGRRKRRVQTRQVALNGPTWLYSHEPDFARAVALLEEVERRFAETPWWHYRRLDQEHRSRTFSVPAWFPDWHSFRARDVARLVELGDRPVAAAGLLSMHPSGYVREAAVRELAATASAQALPFLLVRTADWVEPVRSAAQTAVGSLLVRSRPAELLPAAPLLEQMALDRARASDFAAEMLDLLRTNVDTATLVACLSDNAPPVRRICARFLVERGDVSEEALTVALGQKDVVVAGLIGTAAVDQVVPADRTLDELWGSSVASLRALALCRCQAGESSRARRISEAGLFDTSPTVRFLSQRFLSELGVDLPSRYRRALPERLVGIQGLAEVGDEADAEVIKSCLDDDRPRARAFAVHGLSRLLGVKCRSLVLSMLDDPSPSVARSAIRVLADHPLDKTTVDQVWERTASTDAESFRRTAFAVFACQSRWPKLVLACRAIASDDENLRRRGEHLLTSLRASWNNSFTRPSDAQIDEVTRLEPVVGSRISPAAHGDLLDWLRHADS